MLSQVSWYSGSQTLSELSEYDRTTTFSSAQIYTHLCHFELKNGFCSYFCVSGITGKLCP